MNIIEVKAPKINSLNKEVNKEFVKKHFGHEWTHYSKIVKITKIIFNPIICIIKNISIKIKNLYNKI